MRANPWDPLAEQGRGVDWNSCRGNHLGQRSNKLHQQAGHMDASDPIKPHNALVPRGPSTYGSRARALRAPGRRVERVATLALTRTTPPKVSRVTINYCSKPPRKTSRSS